MLYLEVFVLKREFGHVAGLGRSVFQIGLRLISQLFLVFLYIYVARYYSLIGLTSIDHVISYSNILASLGVSVHSIFLTFSAYVCLIFLGKILADSGHVMRPANQFQVSDRPLPSPQNKLLISFR